MNRSLGEFNDTLDMLVNIFLAPQRRNNRVGNIVLTNSRSSARRSTLSRELSRERERSRSPHPVRGEEEADSSVIVIEDSFTGPSTSLLQEEPVVEEAIDGDDDLIIIKPVIPFIDLSNLPDTPIQETSSENQGRNEKSKKNNDDTQYRCPICLEPPNTKKPMSTMCGHIFCHGCISTAIRETKKCPCCKKPLKISSIHPIYF